MDPTLSYALLVGLFLVYVAVSSDSSSSDTTFRETPLVEAFRSPTERVGL